VRSDRLAGLAIAGAILAPERFLRSGPTLCAFRRLTGRPCPACGITRSWNAAARLRLRDSFRFHPLGIPALVVAVWMVAQRGRLDAGTGKVRPGIVAMAVVAWLGAWLLRLRGPAES
jgi:hypothetical protein